MWLLTGVWHGANWTFIVWGLAYFFMLVIEKSVIKPEQFRGKTIVWIYRVIVFQAVLFCWVIFRADSIREGIHYIKSMFGLYGNPLVDNNWFWYSREYVVLIVLGLILSTPLVRRVLQAVKGKVKPPLFETIKALGYAFLFVACISYLVMGSHNPFIYFNF